MSKDTSPNKSPIFSFDIGKLVFTPVTFMYGEILARRTAIASALCSLKSSLVRMCLTRFPASSFSLSMRIMSWTPPRARSSAIMEPSAPEPTTAILARLRAPLNLPRAWSRDGCQFRVYVYLIGWLGPKDSRQSQRSQKLSSVGLYPFGGFVSTFGRRTVCQCISTGSSPIRRGIGYPRNRVRTPCLRIPLATSRRLRSTSTPKRSPTIRSSPQFSGTCQGLMTMGSGQRHHIPEIFTNRSGSVCFHRKSGILAGSHISRRNDPR